MKLVKVFKPLLIS
jgi:archaellum biogenesis ATPase FlaH